MNVFLDVTSSYLELLNDWYTLKKHVNYPLNNPQNSWIIAVVDKHATSEKS